MASFDVYYCKVSRDPNSRNGGAGFKRFTDDKDFQAKFGQWVQAEMADFIIVISAIVEHD